MNETVRIADDLVVLVRGWLHGNVVVGDDIVIDTGYHSGVSEVLKHLGSPPADVLLTHVHSDHAGGVTEVAGPASTVTAHPDAARLIHDWDERGLWLALTGQTMPTFRVHREVVGGDQLDAGGRNWTVIHTAGHATGGVSWFDPHDGVLVTGDALWEDGFGVLDPWVDGEGVFDDAAEALSRLKGLSPRVVVPGHGMPFEDLAGAIERAEQRLAYLRVRLDRLQQQILRNFAGFLAIAAPEMSRAELIEKGTALAAAHPIDGGIPAAELAEQIIDATLSAMARR